MINKPRAVKILLVFAIVLFQCACSNPDQEKQTSNEAVITGNIANYDEGTFQFTYDSYAFPINHEVKNIEIDSSGDFAVTIQTKSPIKGRFDFGRITIDYRGRNRYIYIYLEPGDSLHVTADVDILSDLNIIENTLAFTGSDVSDNYYVNKEDNLFNTYKQRRYNNQIFIEEKGPVVYQHIVDSIRDTKLAYLENYSKKNGLSPRLYDISAIDYKKLAIIRKINYPSSHARFNDGKKADLPKNYYAFLDDVVISDNFDNKGLPYLRYLHFLLKNEYELEKAKGYDENYLQFVKSQLDDRPLYIYLAYSLRTDFRPDVYGMFGENSPYRDIAEIVHKRYGHLEDMLPGNPVPEVILTSLDGKDIPLSQFQGSNVYLDFWATWCKPCIREIPSLLELEDEYKDKNITFISISFDEDKAIWKEYAKNENMEGIQLWVDKKNKDIIDDFFNIRMIPRFVLLDDQGRIIDADAPRPSSGEEIRELLDSSLKAPKKVAANM